MPSVIGQDSTASGYDPGLDTPPMTYGVWGDTGSGCGVVGSSSHPGTTPTTLGGAGVYGLNNAAGGLGVQGRADDPDGTAVLGTSTNGTGVRGSSQGTGPGVSGESTQGTGVSGTSQGSSPGVAGASIQGTGVSGSSATGVGVTATSTSGTALYALRQPTGGPSIEARLATAQRAGDFTGDVRVSGDVQIGAKLGVGTTAPTHPLQVAGSRGIRQNEMYLSGGPGWSSLSFNAHHDDANAAWVFPDPSRPGVTLEMDDWSHVPRFQVWTRIPTVKLEWVRRFDVNGTNGNVTFPSGRVGVRTDTPAFDLDVNGTACAKQFCNPSDVRVKRDIVPVSDALNRLAAVRAVSYRPADREESAPRQLGVIAQEVEPMFPELVVQMSSAGLKAVDYNGLVGVLVAAVNELEVRNEALAERLAAVERRSTTLPGPGADDDE